MPIPNELLATIADRLQPGGKPGNAAADAIEVWNSLYAKFSPLLGPLSTELLFVRTLSEHARDFPWLAHCATPDNAHDAFGEFTRCLDEQPAEDIVAANQVLLETYITQLTGLIGERLAVRFLDTALRPNGADKNSEENAP
jgi:hypothetical protein